MIETARLILRVPGPGDRDALVGMFTNQEVMAQLYPGMDVAAADAVIAKHDRLRGEGLGFLVMERREDGAVIGFCGLKRGEAHMPIHGKIEAGWLVDLPWWRRGYAREAMAAVLADGWERIGEDRIYAVTSAVNLKSQALIARLGMQRLTGKDYMSTSFPDGHVLQPTVTFAIDRPA